MAFLKISFYNQIEIIFKYTQVIMINIYFDQNQKTRYLFSFAKKKNTQKLFAINLMFLCLWKIKKKRYHTVILTMLRWPIWVFLS